MFWLTIVGFSVDRPSCLLQYRGGMSSKITSWLLALGVLSACQGDGAHGREGELRDSGTSADSGATCGCNLDWQIDNLAVCVVRKTAFTPASVYSSSLDEEDEVACEPSRGHPQPVPAAAWSPQRIQSSCAGKGRLCAALRQGSADPDGGVSSTCTLVEQCFDIDYATPGVPLELPSLSAWSVADATCANRYDESSGFFEFWLESEALACTTTGKATTIRPACPPGCDLEPTAERCKICGAAGVVSSF